jgi:hypothetical protein
MFPQLRTLPGCLYLPACPCAGDHRGVPVLLPAAETSACLVAAIAGSLMVLADNSRRNVLPCIIGRVTVRLLRAIADVLVI